MVIWYFIGQGITQIGMRTPYSLRNDAVSELGVTTCGPFTNPTTHQTIVACSPFHAVMNVTFVIYGLLIFCGILLTRSFWPRRKLASTGVFLVALAGLCIAVAGFAPGNSALTVHEVAASVQFFAQNLGLILLGSGAIKTHRLFGWITLLAGVMGFVGIIMSGTPPYIGLGYGGWQRVGAYPLALWAIGFGVMLLRRRQSAN
ncbi:hypothetical protein CEB3_c50300 [Peptococcaceae bacterium CEB3]|nr:hypothetical protein CEB3_c50300 [Peptococcaceae bacterium CEB3]